LHALLQGDTGIATRHFAVPQIEGVFDLTADQLNEAFKGEGTRLATQAAQAALAEAGVAAASIDALFICTCTGYLCPGLTSYVGEALGLRPDATLHDLVGFGCGAAIPALRAVSHFLAAHPAATVACIAVEICSAAFYLDEDPGVLISACLFSDGAAASLWKSTPGPTGLRCHSFRSLHRPELRDKLRFEQRNGKLRNLLDRSVPHLAAGAVAELWAGRGEAPVAAVVCHPGGRDVLDAIGPAVPGYSLEASRRVLRDCGNMSSPSVLFALAETMRERPAATDDFWLVAFGAGFSAHSCRLGR
jgi:alkylresorcinol/alkylpyrone synthase